MTKKVSGIIAFLVACLAIAVIFSGLPSTVNAACGELIGGNFDGGTDIILDLDLEGPKYCYGYLYCAMQWSYAGGTREQEKPVILAAKDRGSDPKTGRDVLNLEFADRCAAPGLATSANNKLGERAAELAVQVIGAPYLGDGKTWGGKGYEWNHSTGGWVGGKFVEPDEIKNGYWYWNNKEGKVKRGRGLDCSGLSLR